MCGLKIALRDGDRVTPARVSETTGVSERVCRETLYVMSESDWLARHTRNDGSVYYSEPIWLEFDSEHYPY